MRILIEYSLSVHDSNEIITDCKITDLENLTPTVESIKSLPRLKSIDHVYELGKELVLSPIMAYTVTEKQ